MMGSRANEIIQRSHHQLVISKRVIKNNAMGDTHKEKSESSSIDCGRRSPPHTPSFYVLLLFSSAVWWIHCTRWLSWRREAKHKLSQVMAPSQPNEGKSQAG